MRISLLQQQPKYKKKTIHSTYILQVSTFMCSSIIHLFIILSPHIYLTIYYCVLSWHAKRSKRARVIQQKKKYKSKI